VTIQEALRWARFYDQTLSIASIRILLAHSIHQPIFFLLTHPDHSIEEDHFKTFQTDIQKLKEGSPLSRILGEREFWSLPFKLNDATLDPRPDSECLIDAVLKHFPDKSHPLRILDLGTGTGCLLIALLSEYQNATGVGVDQSLLALDAAQANANALLETSKRATFVQSNWFSDVQGSFDVIISNPPYITESEYKTLDKNVKEHDPYDALVGGKDGLAAYKNIIQNAAPFLSPKGILVLEIGHQQKDTVSLLLEASGFQIITILKDLSGIDRCLVASLDL
jgi:release factor glutamine methyltransferase